MNLLGREGKLMENQSMVDSLKVAKLSDYEWLKLAYLALLQRPIDSVGYAYWSDKIKNGTFSYKELIDTLQLSPEYIMHYKIPFNSVVHIGRQLWIKEIGSYENILDIGGSSANTEMGALIEIGYPHRPKSITIFDLPPEQQYWGKPKYDQTKPYNFTWGSVKFVHGQAEKIHMAEELKKLRFDCIFMGQTIEHVNPTALPKILDWIREHLTQGGHFIFDTPNRLITKIQLPTGWIDKDHKYEYTPAELEARLERHHFKVARKWGIIDMPTTSQTRVFNPIECYETEKLSKNYNTSYCFAYDCIVK